MPVPQNLNPNSLKELTDRQKKTVRLVYTSALLPASILSILLIFNKIPNWVIKVTNLAL